MKNNEKLIELILEGMVIFRNYIGEDRKNLEKYEAIERVLNELVKCLPENDKETNDGQE